jgi:hypothetical protein
MTKRNPKGPTKADATMEVADGEVIQASPPPLPVKQEPVEKPACVRRSIASLALPLVRAALRIVKPLEGRLERLEAQLEIHAARPASETTSDDGMATGRA